MKKRRRRSILLFALKFLVSVVVLVVLWWLAMPVYGYLLAQSTGGTMRFALGMPIEYARLDTAGFLNTESKLVFGLDGHERATPFAKLVTNVPPYWALVIATGGIAMRKRLRILAIGTAILVAGHFLFIVLALRFAAALQRVSEVPTAIVQFYLTLPFLLWIVFAYWDKLIGREEAQS